jgi:acetyl-CoA C-acetyltransferase
VRPDEVEYVIMGQVLQAGVGQAPARQAAIAAGIPIEVPADVVNKVCASSVRAIQIADAMIRAGEHSLIVTGGMESMSNAPYLLKRARFGYRLGHGEVLDSMVHDGLVSSFDGLHMVEQSSKVNRELGITREEQDAWAYRSHRRAAAARDQGRFADELVAVDGVTADEGIRSDTTLEALAKLKPVFDADGTTTAGNAPGVNDGASCVIVCSQEYAERRGLEPLATIVSQAYVADDFAYLARTPARSGEKALAKAGKRIGDVKRVEINEAFSSVALNSPVHELRRNGGGLGLAAICSGGGGGDALLIEA